MFGIVGNGMGVWWVIVGVFCFKFFFGNEGIGIVVFLDVEIVW